MIKKYFVIVLLAIFGAGCNTPAPYYPTVDDTTGDDSSATKTYLRTGNYTDLTHNSVTLLGEVKVEIADYESIEWGMMYSADKAELESHLGSMVLAEGALQEDMYSVSVTGLESETQYYYCAFVFLNEKQYKYGSVKSFTTLEAPKIDGIGTFSVSDSKQVTFSKGNLQYTQSTNTWSFASAQYEMIGTDNVTGGSVSSDPNYGDNKEGTALADKVDLFGWSTGATNFGVSTSTDYNDYSGSFVDWGTNQIGSDAPNTWRTLTYDEWKYLLNIRPYASSLKGVAQVNGVNGLIFLPDNWVCPAGVTFQSGFHSNEGVDYYAAYQTFPAAEWSKLESAGAVFLPAAGYRYRSSVHSVQLHGYYWSATEYNSYNARCLLLYSDEATMHYNYRNCGHSVRLVKDL